MLNLGSFNEEILRVENYISIYLDFNCKHALKLAKKHVFVLKEVNYKIKLKIELHNFRQNVFVRRYMLLESLLPI